MKRLICAVSAILLLFSLLALPAEVCAAGSALGEPLDLYVFIPEGKAKTLQLVWQDFKKEADGFQISRSPNGKKGTYQVIGTTKTTSYTDTGLQNQTIYYYAVRAYANRGGKTVYSAYVRDDCCTKVTKKYVSQMLQQAYKVSSRWIYITQQDSYDYNRRFTATEKRTEHDGTTYTAQEIFCRMTNKKITTKKALKKYLAKFFDAQQSARFVDGFYLEKDGALYVRLPRWADGTGQQTARDEVRDIAQRKDWIVFSVIETWNDYIGTFYDVNTHSLRREGKTWVFADEDWFPEPW